MIMPKMLAKLISIVKPKVRHNIPKSSTKGSDNPKLCPNESHDKNDTLAHKMPIKLPRTTPASINSNNVHFDLGPVVAI